LNYTDTHAHLERLSDVHSLLSALFSDGFGTIIDIGTKADDLSRRNAEFSRYPSVRFAAGIWPTPEAVARREEEMAVLRAQIESAGQVAAIGECGLDHHQEQPDRDGERELFIAHLELARELGLPIIVHSRDAPLETYEILRAFSDHGGGGHGVIHCFSYGSAEARQFLDLGYYISFAGNITYKKSEHLNEALRVVPPSRLLLETDSPFLAPQSHRGKPSHPGLIAETYAKAAAVLGITVETLADDIARNAAALFGGGANHET
jgi:TatD DNase family protein